MKRKTLKFMACAAVTALMLSVTACGGSDDGAKNDTVNVEDDEAESQDKENAESQEEKDAEPEAEEAANAGDEDGFATLEEAFSDPTVKAAMDEQLSGLDMDGMEVSYEVTGNDFILTYKVIDTVIDDPDDFAEQMGPVMDQLDPIFSAFAEMFDEALEKEGATTVIVRYFDGNDTLLIESSYKAE